MANEIEKLLKSPKDDGDKKNNNENSTTVLTAHAKLTSTGNRAYKNILNTKILNANAQAASAHAGARASLLNTNILNANAQGASANASANSNLVNTNILNAHAEGAGASASASANAVNTNIGNVSAQGVSARASANASGVNVSAGNVSVTGAEAYATANAKAASFEVGNVSVTGASAGASASVTGTGIQAFNVAVSGPSASVNVGASGAVSFGNISIGLRPEFNIGLGLNIGIPFLGGGSSGSSGSNSGQNNGNNSNANSNEPSFGDRMQEKYPNRTYIYDSNGLQKEIVHKKDLNIEIEKNKDKKPVDEIAKAKTTCQSCDKCDKVAENHRKLENEGYKYVGTRGTESEVNAKLLEEQGIQTEHPKSDSIWAGKYTTNDPSVAAGYTTVTNPDGKTTSKEPAPIVTTYLPKDEAAIYYTNTPLDQTNTSERLLQEVKEITNDNYVFGGPQGSADDTKSPEFVISSNNVPNLKYMPSAHEANDMHRLSSLHQNEVDTLKLIPDYHINPSNQNFDQTRIREFPFENIDKFDDQFQRKNNKEKPMSVQDQILIQKLRERHIQLDAISRTATNDSLQESNLDLTTRLRNRIQANQEINASFQTQQTITSSQDGDNDDVEKPEKCKNHPENVTCMKCLGLGGGAKVKKLFNGDKNIYGFK